VDGAGKSKVVVFGGCKDDLRGSKPFPSNETLVLYQLGTTIVLLNNVVAILSLSLSIPFRWRYDHSLTIEEKMMMIMILLILARQRGC
jgi:hypothetical protein